MSRLLPHVQNQKGWGELAPCLLRERVQKSGDGACRDHRYDVPAVSPEPDEGHARHGDREPVRGGPRDNDDRLVPRRALRPNRPTFTGHFTQWDGFNSNRQSATGTFTFSIHGTGSDGSSVKFHDVEHFTMTKTSVTVHFEKPKCA